MIARRSISILIAVAMFLVAGAIASAGPGEGSFVSKINAERQANGLGALSVHSGLTTYARSHSADMAADGQLYHSTNSQLIAMANSTVPGWQRLGENVGVGGSVDTLHNAFMNSPTHRANILKTDFTHVGIGTVESNGRIYVTQIFVKLPASATTTTTTTTAPSTTTTTTTTTSTTTTTTTTTTSTTTPTTTTTTTTDGSTPPPTTAPSTTTEPEPPTSTTSTSTTTTQPMTTTTEATTSTTPTTTTTTTTTTTEATTSTPTTTGGTPDTSPPPDGIPTTGPRSPGAADTVRLVAGSVLAGSVILLGAAALRRRGIATRR